LSAAVEGCRAIFAVLVRASGALVTVEVPAKSWFANICRLALLLVTRWFEPIITLITLVQDQATTLLRSEILTAADGTTSVCAVQSFCPCQKGNERQADQSHQGG